MINGDESDRLTLELIRQQANLANNKEASAELSKIDIPFNSWEQLYFQRKWTAHFSGTIASNKTYPKKLFEEWSYKWLPIYLEASSINYNESVIGLNCPVYFFLSEKDLVANYKIALQYFENLIADQKEIVWFTESTHEIPSQEPKKFSQELVKIVLSTEKQ
jgi:pimeloyl-ACP methyl ester carboxylesterase